MYFVECQRVDTRQSSLCRVSAGWHSAKNSERVFAECRPGALGKAYFKIKKKLCRVPDHGHSAQHAYIPTVSAFFLTLSLSISCVVAAPLPTAAATSPTAVVPSRPHRRAPRPLCPPCPSPAPAVPAPTLPCPQPRPPCPSPAPAAAPVVPLTRASHARRAHARAAVPLVVPLARAPRHAPAAPLVVPPPGPPPRPRRSPAVPSPARRLARDPSSSPRPNLQGDC
jgi:periplasmic protein TonB